MKADTADHPATAGCPDSLQGAPAVDISERKDAYRVAMELPGVGIQDLEITFEDGLLTIQGQRR